MGGRIAVNEWVTIVSGLPRSGTSMMMQLLEAGGIPPLTDYVRTPDEDNPKGYYEFEAVKQVKDDASWLPDAAGKVVKMVYRLLYDLPAGYSYRVVFMKRTLAEVIASQEEMLRRNGKANGDLDPDELAAIYARQLQQAEAWLRQQPNFEVLYVQYRDVVERPNEVIAALDDFLGGNLDTRAMSAVPDPALYRNRN